MLNSPVDIAIACGVVLLIFGPKKLPELGKALGQGIGNFKRSLLEAQEGVKSAIHNSAADEPDENPRPAHQTADSDSYCSADKPGKKL